MNEWSFIIFTVSMQCVVGTFITLGLIELLSKLKPKPMTPIFTTVLGMMGVGMLTLLASRGNAMRSIASRMTVGTMEFYTLDVMALLLFAIVMGIYVGTRFFDVKIRVQQAILLPCISLGVILLMAISQTYSTISAPLASNAWIAFQFFMTAFVTGPIATIALLFWQRKNIRQDVLHDICQRLGIVSLATMALSLVSYTVYLFWVGSLQLPNNPLAVMSDGYFLVIARILLMFTGVQILSLSAMSGGNSKSLASICLVLLLLAEFSGRAFFLAVHQDTTYVNASSPYAETHP